MFFILVVILHGIQIIALVCMISGPVGTWIKKIHLNPKSTISNFFLEVGYIWRNFRKILAIEIFISEYLEAEKFSLAVKSNHD
jgi:hypothetical protein